MTYLTAIRQVYPTAIRTDGRSGLYADTIRLLEQRTGKADKNNKETGEALSNLRRLGLVDLEGPNAPPSNRFTSIGGHGAIASILPCTSLMDRLKVDLVPIAADDCPVHFCSGFVNLEDLPFASSLEGRLISVGQGLTQAAASLACLGELAERLSVFSRGTEEDLIVDAAGCKPGSYTISAAAVLNYSAAQQADLMREYPDLRPAVGDDIVWEDFSDRRVRVTALDGGTVALAPSLVCLLREGRFYGIVGAPVTSTNGAASWWGLDGARQRAVMELIERDSVACWWANRLIPPRLELDCVRDLLPGDLADWIAARSRSTHFLDLPTDLGCTIIAALSHDGAGRKLAYGFKAALTPGEAVAGATLEMVQMEMHLQTITDNLPPGETGDFAHPLMKLSQTVDVAEQLWLSGSRQQEPRWEETTWPEFVARLADQSIPVWTFDATRADIGVPTVKAISPILRDWSSRFGPGRLYDFPVRLGLREQPLVETKLNPLRFVS